MFEDEVVVAEQPEVVEEKPVERKTVPLDKYIGEKARRKELEKKLAELSNKADDVEAAFFKKYKDTLGFDEPVARELAKDMAAAQRKPKEPERDEIAEEISDLTLEDEFYDDAKVFESDIRKLIADAASKGRDMDVKTAYLKVRNPSDRVAEILRRRTAAPDKSQPKPSGGNSIKQSEALTEQDRRVLKQLQDRDPKANWNADSYRKYIKNT